MSLNYQIEGEGQAIILLHGLFGSLENLNGIKRALENDYQVINVDLPDHGDSPHSQHFSYQQYAESVLALMNELKLDKAIILGHSMGGKVAMTLALQHPDRVSKLIVADIAPATYPDRHSLIFKALTSVDLGAVQSRADADKQLARNIDEQGVRQFLLKSLQKSDTGWRWRFNLSLLEQDYDKITDWSDKGTSYQGQVLFIKGEHSDYLQSQHKRHIAELFPVSQGHIIQGAGHWLHAEKPQQFNQIVADFLNQD